MHSHPVIIEALYDFPIERIWTALTNTDQMKEWYFDMNGFDIYIGTEFSFFEPGGSKYLHQCMITIAVPYQKLQYSWTYPDYSEGYSLVTWEMSYENGKTKLVLIHDGLETFEDGGDSFSRESFAVGWDEILNNYLLKFLKKNEAIQ